MDALVDFLLKNPTPVSVIVVALFIMREVSLMRLAITGEITQMRDNISKELHLLNIKIAEIIVQIQFHDKRINHLEKRKEEQD